MILTNLKGNKNYSANFSFFAVSWFALSWKLWASESCLFATFITWLPSCKYDSYITRAVVENGQIHNRGSSASSLAIAPKIDKYKDVYDKHMHSLSFYQESHTLTACETPYERAFHEIFYTTQLLVSLLISCFARRESGFGINKKVLTIKFSFSFVEPWMMVKLVP